MKWFITQIALGMLWCCKQLVASFIYNWPVIWRANLYFWGTFLTSLSEKLAGILFQDVWPSKPYTVGSLGIATAVSLIALRAYYDGSSQRHADHYSAGRGKNDRAG